MAENNKNRVTIYTDGGADPNPGPGGWAVVLIHNATNTVKELYGGEEQTTNNRMELMAAIKALEALKQPCDVQFYTDSEYLRKGITEWLAKWQKSGWKKKAGGEIENLDLWQRLAPLTGAHAINWEWVKGHTGNKYNERADQLATEAMKAYRPQPPKDVQQIDAEVYLGVSVKDGEGVWGALVRIEGEEEVIVGQESSVTSNLMDIMAATEALTLLPERIRVNVYTYSDYLRNGSTQWIKAWRTRGWKTKEGDPVKNKEAWQALDEELRIRKVDWPSLKDEAFPPSEFEQIEEAIREELQGPGEFNWGA